MKVLVDKVLYGGCKVVFCILEDGVVIVEMVVVFDGFEVLDILVEYLDGCVL